MQEKLHPSLQNTEFTLDDINFPPVKIPRMELSEVDLTTKLTERITLKIPLISSPMDTVTGSRMAILMSLVGGIGVIHYNFPTIEDQMREVEKVRRYEAGFVLDPIVISEDADIETVYRQAEINGFFSYPITEDGTLDTPLVGFVSRRDVRYQTDLNKSVQEVMTPKEKLITAHRSETLDRGDIRTANKIIRSHNLDTLPIVDDKFRVVALVTDSDLSKDERYPFATKDGNKQLKVLVAVEGRLNLARERIMAAKEAGASGIVVDARNIFADQLDIAKWTKKEAPELDVIVGNLVTARVAKAALDEAGGYFDAFRIGIGGGEVCTSTETLGIGRSLGSAIYDIDQIARSHREKFNYIGMIADGGIKMFPIHVVGALMLGADAVMMGSELAALEESPTPVEWDSENHQLSKTVRGMGSAEVIRERAGATRYMVNNASFTNRFPEGKRKSVPYKGPGEENLRKLFMGVRQSFHGLGARNIEELYQDGWITPRKKADSKGTL